MANMHVVRSMLSTNLKSRSVRSTKGCDMSNQGRRRSLTMPRLSQSPIIEEYVKSQSKSGA
jgi:hypothetical protein